MTSPPNPALTEAEQAAFLQSIARVRSAAGRALREKSNGAVTGSISAWCPAGAVEALRR